MTEPRITISGTELTEGQAMAVRVAINNFVTDLAQPEALGDDGFGRDLARAYTLRLQEVLRLMVVL